MQHHRTGSVVHKLLILAVICRKTVDAVREVARLDPVLNLGARINEGVRSKGAAVLLCICRIEFVISGMTGDKIHVIHGSGPLGSICKCKWGVTCILQDLAVFLKFIDGLRDLLDADFLEDGLVIEDIASAQSAVWNGQEFSVIRGLSNCRVDERRMIVGAVHLGQVIDKSGLVILRHRTSAPVHIHIRALAGAHCHNQLLLVIVVLLMDLIDRDVRIVRHEALNGAFLNGLARILRNDVPKIDGERFGGKRRKILSVRLLSGRFRSRGLCCC